MSTATSQCYRFVIVAVLIGLLLYANNYNNQQQASNATLLLKSSLSKLKQSSSSSSHYKKAKRKSKLKQGANAFADKEFSSNDDEEEEFPVDDFENDQEEEEEEDYEEEDYILYEEEGEDEDYEEENDSPNIPKKLKKKKYVLPTDFQNRASPTPRSEWAALDNRTCVTQDLKAIPTKKSIIRRAPSFVILGAMKAGTQALGDYIRQHSQVVHTRRKELHFFDFHFDTYSTQKGILRSDGRRAYRKVFRKLILPTWEHFRDNDDLHAIDESPRYLFWSDRIPQRLLCVAPWTKLLTILRHPVDRAFSQFNMKGNSNLKKFHKRLNITFEDWVLSDIEDLKRTGVIQSKIPAKEFAGSRQEEEAWKTYTRLGTHAPIGRGLYAIQIRQWLREMKRAGKSKRDFLVINSELMRENLESTHRKVLKFLGLPYEPLRDDDDVHTGEYKIKLSQKTRSTLNKFYEPFNEELYDLLGTDWNGIWQQEEEEEEEDGDDDDDDGEEEEEEER